jgi:hypothetical protein
VKERIEINREWLETAIPRELPKDCKDTECFSNNMIMFFKPEFKDFVLVQCVWKLVRKEDRVVDDYHSHCFLFHPEHLLYVDFLRGQKNKITLPIELIVARADIRKVHFYNREQVIYWVNKLQGFYPFDKFIREVHDHPERDWSYLDNIEEPDCPLSKSIDAQRIKFFSAA